MTDEKLTDAERRYLENHHVPEAAKALRCLDAALARADAAERVMRQDCEHHIQRAHSAESEAAALRAENERLRAENSGLAEFAADYAEETDAFESRLAAAEAEAAALRAKVERLKAVMMIQDEPDGCARCEAVMDGHEAATSDICHDCWNTLESRLAAAEALLRQARPLIQPLNGVLERCGNAIDAFLSTLKRATNDRCEFHRNGGCGPCNYCEDSRDE